MEQVSRGDTKEWGPSPPSDTESKTVWVKVFINKLIRGGNESWDFMSDLVWFVIYDLHIREKINADEKNNKNAVSFILSNANSHHLCLLLIINA